MGLLGVPFALNPPFRRRFAPPGEPLELPDEHYGNQRPDAGSQAPASAPVCLEPTIPSLPEPPLEVALRRDVLNALQHASERALKRTDKRASKRSQKSSQKLSNASKRASTRA